ncbi:hypothetical protein WHR41_00641 [Cladosporium halotolerans]|uniref:Amino acid transporter n=1 Tax=Cladosporium halotolerans TaxID=1052096 RepID=A0AB34L0K2_9PEZI
MMAEGSRQRHSEQPYSDSIEMKAPATITMMSDSKGTESVSVDSVSWEGHGEQDKRDMERLGKTQEFKRNFGFWSALGFVAVYMATWEFVLVSLSVGFTNGGFAGLFWCFIVTVTCFFTVVASMAEMSSMAPTSGGQYHWVSEFSPPRWQKFLSYTSGWMSTLGWLASTAGSTQVLATQVVSIVQILNPEYQSTGWQITLLMWAFNIVTILFNTWGSGFLPALEIGSLIMHALGYLVVIIPILVLAPKNSAHEVFVEWDNTSGYSSMGTAFILSQITILYCCLGSDSVAHISEEVKEASITVPRAMVWSFLGNVFFGFFMLIAMLFCIGPLGPVLESDAPYFILFNNTGSVGLSLFLNIILLLLIYAGNITSLATCAREMFAFSRDHGLPFSNWLGKMNTKWNIPFNAVYATSAIVAILSLIPIGSSLAFEILVSLSTQSLLSTYMISIGCVLLKRIRGEHLPNARWGLGRLGLFVNGFGFFYCGFIIVLTCFPSTLPVDLSTANWSPLVWIATAVASMIYYWAYGQHLYTPPVYLVAGHKAEGTGLQHSPS